MFLKHSRIWTQWQLICTFAHFLNTHTHTHLFFFKCKDKSAKIIIVSNYLYLSEKSNDLGGKSVFHSKTNTARETHMPQTVLKI